MVNTSNLATKPTGETGATLSDGSKTYSFLIDPQTISWNSQADYSNNSVLLSEKPDVTWRYSSSTLSIPSVLFASQGMTKDVSENIKQLTEWCTTGATLKFAFGSTLVPRCHITRFSFVEKQWRSGKCTQAEGTLDLVISREPLATTGGTTAATNQFPTATIEDVRPKTSTDGKTVASSTTTTTKKYTERELKNIQSKITTDMKNQAKRRALGITTDVGLAAYATDNGDGSITIKITNVKGTTLYTSTYAVYQTKVS